MKPIAVSRGPRWRAPALCPRCGHPLERIEQAEAAWPVEDYWCPACRSLFVAGPPGRARPALHEIVLLG